MVAYIGCLRPCRQLLLSVDVPHAHLSAPYMPLLLLQNAWHLLSWLRHQNPVLTRLTLSTLQPGTCGIFNYEKMRYICLCCETFV